jgi:hypothetical protein
LTTPLAEDISKRNGRPGKKQKHEVKMSADVVDINEGKVLRSAGKKGKENKKLAS